MQNKSNTSFIVFVDNDQISLARESEFASFLREAPLSKIALLKEELHARVKSFGEQRSPIADTIRTRLQQIRSCLRQAM